MKNNYWIEVISTTFILPITFSSLNEEEAGLVGKSFICSIRNNIDNDLFWGNFKQYLNYWKPFGRSGEIYFQLTGQWLDGYINELQKRLLENNFTYEGMRPEIPLEDIKDIWLKISALG